MVTAGLVLVHTFYVDKLYVKMYETTTSYQNQRNCSGLYENGANVSNESQNCGIVQFVPPHLICAPCRTTHWYARIVHDLILDVVVNSRSLRKNKTVLGLWRCRLHF